MATAAEKSRAKLIDDVVVLAKRDVGASASARTKSFVELFVRAFYANVPPDDIKGETADNLAGAALSLWRFAQQRKPGRPKVRVYTPSLQDDGWRSSHTVVEIINKDMPFLVDSVTAALNHQDAEVHLVIHPIIGIQRGANGKLTSVEPLERARNPESVMQIQVTEQPRSRHEAIARLVEQVLKDVRASVEDWRPMRARCRSLIDELENAPPQVPAKEITEGLAFLRWMDDDHFTYLGYREYSFKGRGASATSSIIADSGLGVLRSEKVTVFDGLRDLGRMPADVREFVKRPVLLRITKANRRATVHRPAHMDTIAVKRFNQKGQVVGERLFIGLFTSVAYSRSPSAIPLLRQKIDSVVARSGFSPHSHDGKALMHILETYPRDELFQIDVEDLVQVSNGILHLQERQRTALFVRNDPFGRYISCLLFVPRDRFDTRLRVKLADMIAEAYKGSVAAFSSQLGDAALARLHVIIKTMPGKTPAVNVDALERRLAEAARSWSDHLHVALVAELGEGGGLACAKRYEKAFPLSYQDDFTAQDALTDIAQIEMTLAENGLSMNLYRPAKLSAGALSFKLYVVDHPVPLSDVLPMLENMGLRVIGEVPYEVKPGDAARSVWIQKFVLELPAGLRVDLNKVRDAFPRCLCAGLERRYGRRRIQPACAPRWVGCPADHYVAGL